MTEGKEVQNNCSALYEGVLKIKITDKSQKNDKTYLEWINVLQTLVLSVNPIVPH